MNQKRPVNLDLTSLKYPPMAIVSILHRLSGLAIFLLLPFILYFTSLSLKSPDSFQSVQYLSHGPLGRLVLWAFFTAFGFHTIAGLRHMIMDLGWGEDLTSGRHSAIAVLLLTVLLAFSIGFLLW